MKALKNLTVTLVTGGCMAAIWWLGVCYGEPIGYERGYNAGHSAGYKRAKLTYECDHDYAEHEVLPKNY